ncbi:Hypothetical predicted protein [Cloeon dipterum]|uniref:NACHT domain-containing protein n=1 Tax=Cloeon dipterum TaxID=197152 RepID=A0A8S1DEA7_9INSE|nr:Hypothetical predicted protein [Cloeon dipterum]
MGRSADLNRLVSQEEIKFWDVIGSGIKIKEIRYIFLILSTAKAVDKILFKLSIYSKLKSYIMVLKIKYNLIVSEKRQLETEPQTSQEDKKMTSDDEQYEICFKNMLSVSYVEKNKGDLPALHFAARVYDVDACRHLVEQGADVNEKCSILGATPLHYAAMNEAHGGGIIDFLLEKGCDIYETDARYVEAFEYALRPGNYKLAMQIDMCSQERHSYMPATIGRVIERALINDNLNFAKFVYNNKRDELLSERPCYFHFLKIACQFGDLEMCKWLMEEVKIDVNQFEDEDWKEQLLNTVECNLKNEMNKILQYLFSRLQFTADEQSQAYRSAFYSIVVNQNICLKDAEELFNGFADSKIQSGPFEGFNWLRFSVTCNNLDVAKLMHDKDGELINEIDEDGVTILHHAAQFGSVEMCRWLIAQGQDLYAFNNKTRANFLHYAALNSCDGEDIIKTFGQDLREYVNKIDGNFQTSLHSAMLHEDFNDKVAEALLELGADLNVKWKGNNLLHFCIVNHVLDCAIFVDGKDNNLIKQRGEGGKSTLHIAADNFDKDICAWLVVSKGAHPRELTVGGKSVLESTCNAEAKQFLLSLVTNQEIYNYYKEYYFDLNDMLLNCEARGKSDSPAVLGYFESNPNGKIVRQNADNVCVLVVHYDFDKVERDRDAWFRDGDAEDVENLRKTFENNRKCNFRSILSPEKEVLLQLIAGQEQLLRFFCLEEVPSVFILFVLSHGKSDGRIYTDHWNEEFNDFTQFTTEDIFESLRKLELFNDCLKITVFGPCRGELDDVIFNSNRKIANYDNRNSCRITFSPDMPNLVIFYSTVETTLAKRNERGTWIATATCDVVNELDKDKPLLVVLSSIQFRLHNVSGANYDAEKSRSVGQTPEVKIFSQDRTFIFRKSLVAAKPPRSTSDAKKQKKESVIKIVSEFYPWKSTAGQNIRGRRAFLFYEQWNDEVEEMSRALSQNLDFESNTRKLSWKSLILYKKEVCDLENDVGCILSCFFGQISEEKDTKEICVLVDKSEVPVSEILHGCVGPNNEKLIGKPKIFILIDQKATMQHDNAPSNCHDFRISATNHSGWLILHLKDKEKVHALIQILKGDQLKMGKSLQELLVDLLISKGTENKEFLNSTLQFLLDFPDWPRLFVRPNFSLIRNEQGPVSTINFTELFERAKTLAKESQVWILSSIAGTGKTTVLREIAFHLGKSDPNVKILRVLLSKNSLYFAKNKIVNEIKYLAETTKNSHEEIKNLIEQKKVIIFLDGFDEICPVHRDKVITLVKALREREISLWIATRPHEMATIIQEVEEKAVMFQIEPFDEEKQTELLALKTEKNRDECNRFLSGFQNKDILQNPLHLSLLAQCNGEGNLYQIYDRVVKEKVDMCLVRKGYDQNNQNAFLEQRELTLNLVRLIAFRLILGVDLIGPGETTAELERLNDFGISSFAFGSVTFIHQTFAEFLASQQFLKDLEDTGTSVLPLFRQEGPQQCRMFVDLFYATLTEEEDIKVHTQYLLTFARGELDYYFDPICDEQLRNVFSLLKGHVTFQGGQGKSIGMPDGPKIVMKAIKCDEIAAGLLDMCAIKDSPQLVQMLPELLEKMAKHNAVGFLKKLKEKFPDLPELIRSRSSDINAAFYAIEEGHAELLDSLLECGVDVNSVKYAVNALYFACMKGDVKCVEVLLKHGAIEAVFRGLEEILHGYYNINLYDLQGFNPTGIHDPLTVAASFGKLDVVQFLLQEKISGFIRDKATLEMDQFRQEWNAFQYAAYKGEVDVAECLLGKSPDLRDKKTRDGKSPLQLAAENKQLEMCWWLVKDAGVDLNSLFPNKEEPDWTFIDFTYLDYLMMLQDDVHKTDVRGKTSLHCAAEYGDLKSVQKLINLGANLEAKDKKGWNAVHFACRNLQSSNYKVLKLLHEKNSLLAKEKTKCGKTALLILIESSNKYSANVLLMTTFLVEEAGVDVTAVDSKGQTAPSVAAYKELSCIDYLVKNKDSGPLLEDRWGNRGIHLAAETGNLDNLHCWISMGGALNVTNSDGSTALHVAASYGHLPFLEELVESGVDLDAINLRDETALLLACRNGRTDVIEYLLAKNADVNKYDENGDFPLRSVIKSDRVELVQKFIDHGANLNFQDSQGRTVLHHAIPSRKMVSFLHANNKELVEARTLECNTVLHLAIIQYREGKSDDLIRWLIEESGVDVNAVNCNGFTALQLACSEKKWNAVEILLLAEDIDANINLAPREDPTLHILAETNRIDLVQKLTIDRGADLTIKNDLGMNVIHYALKCFEMLKFLHEKNDKLVHELTNDGGTTLFSAIYQCSDTEQDFTVIRWLVEEAKVDLNVTDQSGQFALEYAAALRKFYLVEYFLTKNVEVNKQGSEGKTTLHHATRLGSTDVVQKLLDRGADLTIKDQEGKNVLHCALEELQMVQFLHERNGKLVQERTLDGRTSLHLAIEEYFHSDDLICWLVEVAMMDPNATTENGETALLIACQFSKWDVVDFLLTKQVDPNIADLKGTVPLHLAAKAGKLELVKSLIKCGADSNLKDNEGKNSLHHALQFFEIVVFLHDFNSELVSAVTNDGKTSLHLAIEIYEYCLEVIRWHMDVAKIDLNARNENGETALMISFQLEKWDLIDFLLTKNVDANIPDRKGTVPLHLVAGKGDLELVKKLIECGADPAQKDIEGKNSLHHALQFLEVIEFLHDFNSDLVNAVTDEGKPILHLAIERYEHHLKAIHWLIEVAKIDLNTRNDNGETALLIAIKLEKLDLIDFLLTKNVDANIPDGKGTVPLHLVAVKGDMELVKKLIECGADPAQKDSEGKNSLHHALQFFELVSYLHEIDSDLVSAVTNDGRNSLHLAMEMYDYYAEVIRWLVEGEKVDLNACNAFGETALLMACKRETMDIVQGLLMKNVNISIKDREENSALQYAIDRELPDEV